MSSSRSRWVGVQPRSRRLTVARERLLTPKNSGPMNGPQISFASSIETLLASTPLTLATARASVRQFASPATAW